ncbi:MAG: hypothetical protein ACM3ZQ_06910, partial [Bacillota bacterium]
MLTNKGLRRSSPMVEGSFHHHAVDELHNQTGKITRDELQPRAGLMLFGLLDRMNHAEYGGASL